MMTPIKFTTVLIILVLVGCNTNNNEVQEGIGEEGIAGDAIDYELKDYDEDTTRTPSDSAAYAYDRPPTKMNPKRAVRDNVKYMAETNPLLNRYKVEVEEFNDTLVLKGEVFSAEEKQQIEDSFAKLDGVKFIKNQIILKSPAYGTSFYGNHAYPVMAAPEMKSDEQIKEEIIHELSWSPFVNEDNIEVSVNNGNVTLTGSVETRTEKKYAEINAIEGGAFTVQNHLVVEYAH